MIERRLLAAEHPSDRVSREAAVCFDLGDIHAVIHPAEGGRLARFVLYRAVPGGGRVMIASGSDDSMGACLSRATRAASCAAEPS